MFGDGSGFGTGVADHREAETGHAGDLARAGHDAHLADMEFAQDLGAHTVGAQIHFASVGGLR